MCVVVAAGCEYRVKQWAFVSKFMWVVVNFGIKRVWMIEMNCMTSFVSKSICV